MRKIAVSVLTGALGLVIALGLAVTSGSPAQAANRMQIHEIYYNSPGSDSGSNSSLNHEWVQLHNTSGSRIKLTGWTLRDKQGHVYTFGTYTINAHGYVKIHTGKGTNTQTDRYWGHSWYVWNNTGDQATLENRSDTVIDRCSYTGTSTGFKIC
jgi:Lamin Tail Domain